MVRYLKACYDPKSGGFSDRPGANPDAISTAVGLMILGEVQLPVELYREAGLKFMNENTEGFEQIRMVASALEELGRRVPQADQWLKAIDQAPTRTALWPRAWKDPNDCSVCGSPATARGKAGVG